MSKLHPQARAVLDEIAAAGGESNGPLDIEQLRRLQTLEARFQGEPAEVGETRDLRIEGPGGPLRIRMYLPKESPSSSVLFVHGGGWALGSIENSDNLCRALCQESDAVIASVDYRLAPEHRFPAALDDVYAALAWLDASAGEFGTGGGRLAVCGDSAGGNLAAAVALMARDRRGPEIALQVLIYPALDPRLESESFERAGEGYGLTREDMRYFWDLYLGDPHDATNPYASPLLAATLKGLPPALTLTAEYDPLADEGYFYHVLLGANDVPVRWEGYPGMIHGFVSYLGRIDAARHALRQCASALKTCTVA
jgi:acetyl esterase